MTRANIIELRRDYQKMAEQGKITPNRYLELLREAWDSMSAEDKEVEYNNNFTELVCEGWQDNNNY